MKLSNILLIVLAASVAAIYAVGITVPQETLNTYQWYYAACIVPPIGALWLGFLALSKREQPKDE